MMQCNVGKADRGARFVIGAGMIGAGIYFRSWWGALGLVLIGNAVMGVCGLYRLLGISTYKGRKP